MHTFEGSPMAAHVPPDWGKKVIHVSLKVDSNVLMGSDAAGEHYQTPQGFSASLGFANPAEAVRIFNALADGGTVQMPFQKTFWSAGFGMLVDQFGTPWMVNCEEPA